MENKKLILEERITKLAINQLVEKYQKGQIDEVSFTSHLAAIKGLAGNVANKFVDKAKQAKQGLSDTISNVGDNIKTTAQNAVKTVGDTLDTAGNKINTHLQQNAAAYKKLALANERKETEQAFETFVKALNKYNQDARQTGVETLSIQGMLNKYRRQYPNLYKESEEPIISPISKNSPINESNEIKYKGKTINILKTGFYEYYSDKEGRFLKFDNLKDCKYSIDQEESLNESKDEKWMQDVDMKKGKLKSKLGLGEDEKLTISRVNSELKKLKDKYKEGEKMSKADLTFEKELVLAKTFLSSKK